MNIKYKTSKYDRDKITPVEVVKETAKMLIYIIPADKWSKAREDKTLKVSEYSRFHDTWEQARDYLLAVQYAQLTHLANEKHRTETLIGNIKSLKKPEPM